MTAPLRIQLAVQGGGAKIAALIAAMTAIEELRDNKTITVTRVAGTSAGSIVGALFAAGVPMSAVRAKLLEKGPSLSKLYKLPGWVFALSTILRGKSLWKQTEISTLLQELLDERPAGAGVTLGAMNPPMLITATDLYEHRLLPLRDGSQAVASMLHSAAIPFAFRSHKQDWLVDGGICENLPASLLLPEVGLHGPVLALSFLPEFVDTQRKKSLKNYCMSLLLAAMNNSVSRAKEQLGASCIELDTNLTTFDFEKALKFLKDEKPVEAQAPKSEEPADAQAPKSESPNTPTSKVRCATFSDVIKQTRKSVRKWVELTRAARVEASAVTDRSWEMRDATDPVAVRYRDTQRLLAHVYREQHGNQPVIYRKLQLRVVARSLDSKTPGLRDEFTMVSVIDTKDEPCYCHKVSLIDAKHDNSISSTDIEVFDKNGVQLKSSAQVPIEDQADKLTREVLIFFIPPLRPGNGPYTVRYRSEAEDILKPLQLKGVDELFVFGTRPNDGLEDVSVVLMLPRAFGEVELSAEIGEPMSVGDLAAFQDSVPFGYLAKGYQARNLPQGTKLTVDIKRT